MTTETPTNTDVPVVPTETPSNPIPVNPPARRRLRFNKWIAVAIAAVLVLVIAAGIVVDAHPVTSDMIGVTVSDTGCGIPAEHLSRIFDRFYQVETSRTRHGVGLGLTIALDIARAHQGTIDVKSTVGVGTTFTVLLRLSP